MGWVFEGDFSSLFVTVQPDRDELIGQAILDHVNGEENPGLASGGSSHLSFITISLSTLTVQVEDAQSYHYKAVAEYVKSIETEFTYVPDNPPQEYTYRQEFYFDRDLIIVGYSRKQLISPNYDLDFFLPEE